MGAKMLFLELIDFRKINGASDAVLRKLSAADNQSIDIKKYPVLERMLQIVNEMINKMGY